MFSDLHDHYETAFEETDKRRTGRGRVGSISFDEADELFRSWLDENKWPYDALVFDPRIFTFIVEKTSRLFSNKLKGRLLPREGGDVLKAHINNELLSYQWDRANHHGSMMSKWSLMDINTRKYGAAFALCKWRYEKDGTGKVVFDGPEMKVLNNRDCGPDIAATSIEDCNWFQVREYVSFDELKKVNDAVREKPIYQNLDKLEYSIKQRTSGQATGGDTRGVNWLSRNREISGLTVDPIGQDSAFRTIEIVTEYRRDRWYTFAPRYGVVLRDIENPYKNNEIPVIMLRYYAIDDDLYGVSEIEPVKSLQKGVNALLCQYLDEINQKLYTPIALAPGVRDHTIKWGKNARWRMNNPQTDFRIVESSANAAAHFNNTYSALVASMMTALGETSLGVSNAGRFNPEKTATEVQALAAQQNARDSFNQNFLAEAIQRQMRIWHRMNQVMLFSDPERHHYIVRVVGNDAVKYFQELGLNQEGLSHEAAMAAAQMPEMDPTSFSAPLQPVNIGSDEEPEVVPKFMYDDKARFGQLVVEEEDLQGDFDFVADVISMAMGAEQTERQGRSIAITALMSNPNVLEMLRSSGTRPKFKELFVQWLEDSGFKDAEKYFEQISKEEMQGMMAQAQGGGDGIDGRATRGPGGYTPGELDRALPNITPNSQSPNVANVGSAINQLMNPNATG